MVDTVTGFEQVFITYKDVREANSGWTEEMIEDYLSLKRDLTNSTETADLATDTSSISSLLPGLIQRLEALENVQHPKSLGLTQRIEDLENVQQSKYGQIALDKISKNSLEEVDVSADFTTSGNQFITCNNTTAIDLTLNPYPENLEELYIKRNAIGAVNFIGNIDGNTNEYVVSVGDGIHLIYTEAMGYWGAV